MISAEMMAYLDGELDDVERSAFEARLLVDIDLRRQVARLRELNAVTAIAFNQAAQGEMPALRAFAKAPARHRTGWLAWLFQQVRLPRHPFAAVSLSILLAAVVATGLFLPDAKVATEHFPLVSASDHQIQMETMNQLLETQLSGTTAEWFNQASGNAGTLTVNKTFQTAQGQYCREFTEALLIASEWQEQRVVACRSAEQEWTIKARFYL